MTNTGAGNGQDPAVRIELRALFATPVAMVVLPEAARINAQLKDAILTREQVQPTTHHSNLGGWQSSWDFQDWSGDAGARLLIFVQGMANKLTKWREGGAAEVTWRINAWANINRRGHGNELHIHPGSFWSGVYYVDDGGAAADPSLGGEFEMADPRGPAPAMYRPDLVPNLPGAESNGANATLRPAAGQVLLFPAWLSHAVRPYWGDGTRISVAYNLSV